MDLHRLVHVQWHQKYLDNFGPFGHFYTVQNALKMRPKMKMYLFNYLHEINLEQWPQKIFGSFGQLKII